MMYAPCSGGQGDFVQDLPPVSRLFREPCVRVWVFGKCGRRRVTERTREESCQRSETEWWLLCEQPEWDRGSAQSGV